MAMICVERVVNILHTKFINRGHSTLSDIPADLSMILRQQRQIIADIGAMRDDMAVLTAVAMRQDATLTALLTEIRAMHSQHGRLANRVRELETSGGTA
jgi:hypothetical protein